MKKDNHLIKRIILPLLLTAIMILLCGCAEIKITHPLSKDTILEINDTECSSGTALLRLFEAREEYENAEDAVLWDRMIGSTTLAEYVRNTVKDELLRFTASQVMANDLTVFLSDAEQTEIQQKGTELFEHLTTKYDLSAYDVTVEDAIDLCMKRAYYNKVYEKLSENIYMEISEADTKAISIDYVLIPAEDGIELAEQMRSEMKNGAAFMDVCNSYGYEEHMNVVETKGSMPSAFETHAYALTDNELSEVVETKEGYYIIYCLEDYMVAESIANSNKIITDGKRERFNEAYTEFAATNKMRFNNSEWEKLNIFAAE